MQILKELEGRVFVSADCKGVTPCPISISFFKELRPVGAVEAEIQEGFATSRTPFGMTWVFVGWNPR